MIARRQVPARPFPGALSDPALAAKFGVPAGVHPERDRHPSHHGLPVPQTPSAAAATSTRSSTTTATARTTVRAGSRATTRPRRIRTPATWRATRGRHGQQQCRRAAGHPHYPEPAVLHPGDWRLPCHRSARLAGAVACGRLQGLLGRGWGDRLGHRRDPQRRRTVHGRQPRSRVGHSESGRGGRGLAPPRTRAPSSRCSTSAASSR